MTADIRGTSRPDLGTRKVRRSFDRRTGITHDAEPRAAVLLGVPSRQMAGAGRGTVQTAAVSERVNVL